VAHQEETEAMTDANGKRGVFLAFDIRTAITILAFFGITGTAMLGTIRMSAWWLIAPVVNAKADTIIVHERARTDSVVKVATDSIGQKVQAGFDTLEDLLMQVPQVARAVDRRDSAAAAKAARDAARNRIFRGRRSP